MFTLKESKFQRYAKKGKLILRTLVNWTNKPASVQKTSYVLILRQILANNLMPTA